MRNAFSPVVDDTAKLSPRLTQPCHRSRKSISRAIQRFFERGAASSPAAALPFAAEPLEGRTLLSLMTFPVTADTFVQFNNTSANFGTSTSTCALPLSGSGCLVVLNTNGTSSATLSRITYLKFNPIGITGNINSAVLRLVGVVANGPDTPPGPKNDDVYGVGDTTWIESGAGYMTYDTRKSLDQQLDTQSISGPIKPYFWSVLGWIQSHPNQEVSFAVQEQTQASLRHFYRSREYAGTLPGETLSDAPKLIFSVGVPDTPSPLTATAGNSQVTLNWPAVDATSYTVYRGTTSGALSLYQSGITTNTFVDTVVTNGTQYFYHIVATNNSGDSLPSNEASATPFVGQVTGPTPVLTAGFGTITATWDPVQFADSYNIYRSETAGFTIGAGNLLATNVTSPYVDNTPVAGVTYYYKMTAVNAAGEGAPGGEVSSAAGVLGTGTGITANIYDNIDFTGASLTRVDPNIDFDFDGCCAGSPDPSIGVETFSIRWIGQVEAQFSEAYTFYTITDDGVRLWVNEQLIIDRWIDQGATQWASAPINLVAGQKYDIRMDFYENGGAASARLHWSSAATPQQPVPQTQLYPDDGIPRRPAAPAGITANVVDESTICVLWSDVAYNEDRYILQRSEDRNFTGPTVTDIVLPATPNVGSCQDSTVVAGRSYFYRAAARNAVGDSPWVGTGDLRTMALSALARAAGNVATGTTAAPHGFVAGAAITIAGAAPNSFNGSFTIATVPSATTFTFTNAGAVENATQPGTVTYAPPPVVPAGTPGPINYTTFPDTNPDLVLVDGGDPGTPPPSFLNGRLRLTDPINGAAGAVWTKNVKLINSFTSSFEFQFTESNGADGMVFVIQANSNTIIGGAGGSLGFAGIPRSVGIKIDFYPNLNQTGVYVNGAMNDTIGINLNESTDIGGFGFDFDNGTIYHVDIAYDGTEIVYTVSDPAVRSRTASLHYTVDIAGIIGSECAFVGFTAANGGLHATHEVLNWNFTSGAPVVNGTPSADTFYVRQDAPGGSRVHVWKNRDPLTNPTPDIDMAKADVTNLALNGGRGNDTFTIDMSNGNPLPAGGLLTDGGQGSDLLIVTGTSAAESFLVDGTQVTVPGGQTFKHLFIDNATFNLGANTAGDPDDSVTLTAVAGFTPVLNGGGGNNTLTLNAGTHALAADSQAGNNDGAGNDTLNVVLANSAVLNLNSSQHLKSLTLNNLSRTVVAPGGDKLIRTGTLDIAAGASLDVGDGDVIVQSTAGSKMADWNRLIGYLVSGRAGGAWNGNGIRSLSAANNATRATNVGIILNDAGGGVPILGTFNGENVDANSILLKYTYYGDRDFDGDLDADDYAGIDGGWANQADPNNLVFPRQGSRHGDIDHSGAIDSDDFFLIDRAFSNQAGVLSDGATAAAASSSATATSSKAAAKSVKKVKARKVSHHRAVLFRVRD